MAAVSITAASVLRSANGVTVNKTAGAAITAGQPVYFDTDGTAKPADCDGASPLYKVEGIAVNNAATGQDVDVCVRDPEFTLGGTTAKGIVYIAGATAGAIHPSADATTGWRVSVLGVGISATQINLFPCPQCRSDVAI